MVPAKEQEGQCLPGTLENVGAEDCIWNVEDKAVIFQGSTDAVNNPAAGSETKF